jgi:hypothetical protein
MILARRCIRRRLGFRLRRGFHRHLIMADESTDKWAEREARRVALIPTR